MEFNKNDNYNNGDNENEQLQKSARKRKLNQLTNDEDKPAETAGQEDQECANSKKNRDEGNDMDLELELEHLSRDELIKLVRKQMTTTMEAQKQLETTKKEAEESAKQAAENQIVQLKQKNAELHEDLNEKLVEIMEMHMEVEEKSGQLAEKAKQIDALLVQLNEHISPQHQMQTEQEMKIQLSLETWYDWLAFVPRHQLGQVVPMIGDRKFGSIVQKFLHEYGEITIDNIAIVAPFEDPSGHPRVRKVQNNRHLRFEMAEAQIPANIKNFKLFELSYFDQSVLNFMQKFQRNCLLDNVKLSFGKLSPKMIQPVLCHLLPLIKGFRSISLNNSAQLVDFYDAENSNEIYERNIKMMEETRILGVNYRPDILHATQIDLYSRWLYQTARADRKPRMLFLGGIDVAPISLFIDRLKQDFLIATYPATFIIRIRLSTAFQQEDICLDNGQTKERLLTKMEKVDLEKWEGFVLLISRYPLASTKKWIAENEKEALTWHFRVYNEKRIYLSEELKVVPI